MVYFYMPFIHFIPARGINRHIINRRIYGKSNRERSFSSIRTFQRHNETNILEKQFEKFKFFLKHIFLDYFLVQKPVEGGIFNPESRSFFKDIHVFDSGHFSLLLNVIA